MASEALFNTYPPFPKDVQTASLYKISLAKLSAGDEEECKALFNCCRTLGFFILDLSGDETGEALVKDVDATMEFTKELMKLPHEEKIKHRSDPPRRLFGYKHVGYMKTDTDKPDRCEFYMITQDEISGSAPKSSQPEYMTENMSTFTSYLSHAQPIVQTILHILSTSFGLPPDSFHSKMSPSDRSGTMFRLIKYPGVTCPEDQRTSLVPHTDMGTITLLANVIGGLEILPPSQDGTEAKPTWLHVKPEPKCLIVNIGDAMVEWTGGVLRSNMHRVTYPPGEQAAHDRYSVAYLVRATGDIDMRRLKGGLIPDLEEGEEEIECTASEWEQKKNIALSNGKDCAKSKGGMPLKGERADSPLN